MFQLEESSQVLMLSFMSTHLDGLLPVLKQNIVARQHLQMMNFIVYFNISVTALKVAIGKYDMCLFEGRSRKIRRNCMHDSRSRKIRQLKRIDNRFIHRHGL